MPIVPSAAIPTTSRSAPHREARLSAASGATGPSPMARADRLRMTVHRHLERLKSRDRVIPAAVLGSAYHRGLAAAADVLMTLKPPPQEVVADVSAG